MHPPIKVSFPMFKLHPLLVDDAVLQCEKPLVISGTASPGAAVSVRFAAVTAVANATDTGAWSVHLPAFPSGGPHHLIASSGHESLSRKGLLLGEVWLCSGQSNMEWTLGMLSGQEADIASAEDPFIRFFTLPRSTQDRPVTEMSAVWLAASPKNARDFSATAYYFACRLRIATNRPVGVVVSACGGSSIASWLPLETLMSRPQYQPLLPSKSEGTFSTKNNFTPHSYEARSLTTEGWESVGLCEEDWTALPVPGYWQESGWLHNGAVWYRHEVALPSRWQDRELVLEIGACDDFDETFVNGVLVGRIGPEAPSAYATRRIYSVPASLVSEGSITIAIRVFDHWGNGGIAGGVWLRCAVESEEAVSLSGQWKARVEKALPWRAPDTSVPPCALYNGMIHPLVGCGLRGFLWYQGESDVRNAALYRLLLPDLIATWRTKWSNDKLPFGLVQIANHQPRLSAPAESDLAELREAQLLTARTVPFTGLAVTIDVGEADNIHPRQKRPVGERLARWALATVYGQAITPRSSPLPARHWIEDQAICVQFTHTGAGLKARDGTAPKGFQIADASRIWRWADAEIFLCDSVRISIEGLIAPLAVRYGWQANPLCTLENSAGLPASPFRTDDWPLTTEVKS
jgi:sialate O-acetylesterase